MYIIYLYIIYILFISLVRLFKNSSPNGPAACMFRPYCYLLPLIVKIAPAHGKCPPLLKEKNISRCFAIPPQSRRHRMPIAVSDVSHGVRLISSHAGNRRQQAFNSL